MNKNHSGFGALCVLQIVFIALRLVGIIMWPWTVVFMPLWACVAISFITACATYYIDKYNKYIENHKK